MEIYMSTKEYLAGAKMAGSVQKLMTPGLAVEFIQPWYTPLSTTPSTTGIAVGGIGSTFTATPAGTTPVMNVMPGVQVRTEKASDLRFNNFFFREAVISDKAALAIQTLQHSPPTWASSPWLTPRVQPSSPQPTWPTRRRQNPS